MAELYATALAVTRRNVGPKWGHPKYSCRVGSDELRQLCEGVVAFVRAQRAQELDTSKLTAEDVDVLIRVRNEMRNAERRSPDIMYYPVHLADARRALDKLLKEPTNG